MIRLLHTHARTHAQNDRSLHSPSKHGVAVGNEVFLSPVADRYGLVRQHGDDLTQSVQGLVDAGSLLDKQQALV